MPTRSSGKLQGRTKAESRGAVKSEAKTGRGAKTASPKAPGGRPGPRWPRTKGKNRSTSGLFHARPYILGLGLGLLVGGLVAVIVSYWPEFKKKAETIPAISSVGRASTAKPPIVYEEKRRLDTFVKQMDQAIFTTLKNGGIPEQHINIAKVTPRRARDQEWEQAEVVIEVPRTIVTEKLVTALRNALGTLEFRPPPRLKTRQGDGGLSADLTLFEYPTHQLKFVPATDRLPEESRAPVNNPPVASTGTKLKPESATSSKPESSRATANPTSGGRPKVAIVIDDFGPNLEQARCFMELNLPVAISVLPFQPHTAEIAKLAHQKGLVTMLHLPMQPATETEVGPGALLTSMERTEIRTKVQAALAAVPHIAGVNNHMGSKFSEDRAHMGWALEEIRNRGLFFLDSRTSLRSVAYDEAKRLGVPAGRRAIFLDNVPETQAIQMQLKKLVADARQNGSSIGIGHVYPVTCQVLKNEYNHLSTKVDFVPVTSLIR